jgi:hypothetical protein
MSSASHADGPEEDRRRRAAADTLPVMGSVEVVELHEATQAVTQGRPTGEVVAAEDDPPVLAEDRLLQPLDEPVGPGMPRLNAGLANPKLGTDRGELRLEFIAPIREHALDAPARAPRDRHHDVAQEPRGRAIESRYSGRVSKKPQRVSAAGLLPTELISHAAMGDDRSASYSVKGRNCEVTLEYMWGEPALLGR